MKYRLLLALVVTALTSGCAKEPTTYADCVLSYLKQDMSDQAILEVRHACQLKFPAPIEAYDPDPGATALAAANAAAKAAGIEDKPTAQDAADAAIRAADAAAVQAVREAEKK